MICCCYVTSQAVFCLHYLSNQFTHFQGLELAADCHLARVTQAMHLLQAPKHTSDDIAAISGTCFKLNSLQLRALLSNYQPSYGNGETDIANELIDNVVTVAQNTADEVNLLPAN